MISFKTCFECASYVSSVILAKHIHHFLPANKHTDSYWAYKWCKKVASFPASRHQGPQWWEPGTQLEYKKLLYLDYINRVNSRFCWDKLHDCDSKYCLHIILYKKYKYSQVHGIWWLLCNVLQTGKVGRGLENKAGDFSWLISDSALTCSSQAKMCWPAACCRRASSL